MSSNDVRSRPERVNDELIARYREASDALDEMPSPKVRANVLAEASRIASERAAAKAVPKPALRAANDSQWRYALAASVFIASVTGFIAFQLSGDPTEDRAATVALPPPVSAARDSALQAASAPQASVANTQPAASDATAASARAAPSPSVAQAESAQARALPSNEKRAAVAQSAPATVGVERRANTPSNSTVARGSAPSTETTSAPTTNRESNVVLESREPAIVFSAPAAPVAPAPTPAPTAAAAPASSAAGSAATQEAMAASAPTTGPATRATRATQEKFAVQAPARADAPFASVSEEAARSRVGDLTPAMREQLSKRLPALAELRQGVQTRDAKLVERALANGANANLVETDGDPLIVRAARLGSVDVAAALIRGGASVNARNRSGESALDLAERSGNTQMVELLLRAGATR